MHACTYTIYIKILINIIFYQAVTMKDRFEDVLFDTENFIVEYTRIVRTKAVAK